jgi:hypothetical protein
MRCVRSVAALAMSLSLLIGNVVVCAGWGPTSDARMACCRDEANCPMHSKSDAHHSHASSTSHSQADACCAASEQRDSTKPRATSIASAATALAPAIVIQPFHAVFRTGEGPRATVPLRASPVPKHLLLSVFLV